MHKSYLLVTVIGPPRGVTIPDQGVIARVISKSDKRKARGRFEIMSTIPPCIVRHEVQLLINRT